MLATKLKPVSKAVDYSGASMDKWEYKYYGNIFFYSCRNGIDATLRSHMFVFIEDCAPLCSDDDKCKKIIWRWFYEP